jgi:hypothetical protein
MGHDIHAGIERTLRGVQKLSLAAVLILLLWSLKGWVNESYYADWWFQWRQAFPIDLALFFLLLVIGRALLIAADGRLRRFLPRSSIWLLVLPILAVWSWYPTIHGSSRFSLTRFDGDEPFKVGEKTGCKTAAGQVVLPAIYDFVQCEVFQSPSFALFEGRPLPVQKDGIWGFLDQSSFRTVVAPQFESAGSFTREGLAPVKRSGKWGMIAKSGILRDCVASRGECTIHDYVTNKDVTITKKTKRHACGGEREWTPEQCPKKPSMPPA